MSAWTFERHMDLVAISTQGREVYWCRTEDEAQRIVDLLNVEVSS